MPITVEWTESCRSGGCAACTEPQDEVLYVDLHQLKRPSSGAASFTICPKCANELSCALRLKLNPELEKAICQ